MHRIITPKESLGTEKLYVETADAEHVEMYLKAMWRILEKGQEIKIVSIAKCCIS
jgi:DtxR family transcriptional regulator, Mn-dependent transcriptional regulator